MGEQRQQCCDDTQMYPCITCVRAPGNMCERQHRHVSPTINKHTANHPDASSHLPRSRLAKTSFDPDIPHVSVNPSARVRNLAACMCSCSSSFKTKTTHRLWCACSVRLTSTTCTHRPRPTKFRGPSCPGQWPSPCSSFLHTGIYCTTLSPDLYHTISLPA